MNKISVCMATFNGETFIQDQINSILNQLKDNDEIIISDDSSTDSTVKIIKKMGDKRIHILENNTFYNPIYNFENALRHASGDIIYLSDQDDIWNKDKVEKVSSLLQTYDLVVSDCAIMDEKGCIIEDSFYRLRKSGPGVIKNIIRNTYLGCCMAFRRNILTIALPFPRKIPMHDMWIGIIAEVYGKTYFCKDTLVLYRRHSGNISPTAGQSPYSLVNKFMFRAYLTASVIRRIII